MGQDRQDPVQRCHSQRLDGAVRPDHHDVGLRHVAETEVKPRVVTREADEILDAALALPRDERAELAAILTDSIGGESSPEDVQAAWLAEAKRRFAAYERGETQALDFEETMSELIAKDRRPSTRRASTG